MRVAILADIHSNAVALKAVLEQLRAEPPDRVVCLGDVAATGPLPRETLQLIRDLHCPVVLGNADEWMLNPVPSESEDEAANRIADIDFWSANQLSEPDLQYIRTFKATVEIELEQGVVLFCCHGSPHSNTESVLPTSDDKELEEILLGVDANVVALGHTHAQMLRRFANILLINPGSVGLPFEAVRSTGQVLNPPWAEYALLRVDRGQVGLEFRRVPFDVSDLVDAAKASGMPHAEWWCEDWMRKRD